MRENKLYFLYYSFMQILLKTLFILVALSLKIQYLSLEYNIRPIKRDLIPKGRFNKKPIMTVNKQTNKQINKFLAQNMTENLRNKIKNQMKK